MSIGAKVAALPDSAKIDEAGLNSGLIDHGRMLWRQLLGLAHDRLQLAALETRLAGQSLVAMVAAGVMVALLVVSAWIGLLAAVVVVMVGAGLSAIAAILLGAAGNLLVAVLLCAFIRRKSRHLLWSATLRGLRSATTLQKSEQATK